MHWALGRRLGEILDDPGNGFGVLRVILALAVVFSHSFYLTTGLTADEPLFRATGLTLGQHAVYAFFVLSGLLVTASLARAETLRDFAKARALRILPGLLVCVGLTAFVLGPMFTTLPLGTYVTSSEPYLYVLKTAAFITGNAELPGVFETNRVAGEINIPVWTLKYEVACYVALGALAMIGVFRSWGATTFVLSSAAVAAVLVAAASGTSAADGHAASLSPAGLGLSFTIGVAAFVMRDRLPVGLAPIGISIIAYGLCRGSALELPALSVLTAALALGVVILPFGRLASLTQTTDLSYGTYIYGWPVMQLLLVFDPGLSQMQLFLLALTLILPLAYLSWRLVERPALGFKRRKPVPQLGSLGQRITAARPPIAPEEAPRLDVDGEAMLPPPTRRRINRALRVSTRQTMRVVKS